MHLKRIPRALVIGLAAALFTLVALNMLTAGVAVAQEEEEPTPTPILTATATPVPDLIVQASVSFAEDGDLNDDGIVNPGDTMVYAISLVNNGETITGPVTLMAQYDASFISGVANISEGGLGGEGEVVWNFDQVEAGQDINLTFDATMRGRFPAGRTQVTAAVVVKVGTVELARTTAPTVEVLGPNLRLIDESFELITDANENGRIDPGDTVRFAITYQNTGGGPSQEASIIANYPEDLTQAIISTSVEADDIEGQLIWQIGSVPAGGEPQTIAMTVVFKEEFPPGVTTYDLPTTLRSATATLDERTISVPVSGPNVLIQPMVELIADADGDRLADAGDIVEFTFQYENVGTETARNVVVVVGYEVGELVVASIPQDGVLDAEAGTITWTLPALEPGAGSFYKFQGTVGTLAPGLENISVLATLSTEKTAATAQEIRIAVDAPVPTPDFELTPTASLITESRPPQGAGILSGAVVATLIGIFLVFGLLALIYVSSRVLPGSQSERENLDEEERQLRNRLVREIVEGVVLIAILFSVMLLGLQNTLDQDSVNSIIAGIVGYVAGRVASAR
jgi:hypothetical protein